MESRIAKILNQMNEENYKLKNIQSEYESCQNMRKAERIRLQACVWAKNTGDISDRREDVYMEVKEELATKILDIIEAHCIELGRAQNAKLEELVEEMKNVGSNNQ